MLKPNIGVSIKNIPYKSLRDYFPAEEILTNNEITIVLIYKACTTMPTNDETTIVLI